MNRLIEIGRNWGLALAVAALAVLGNSTEGRADDVKELKKAPDFELVDQSGKKKKLSDLLKKGRVAIVFYRSASW